MYIYVYTNVKLMMRHLKYSYILIFTNLLRIDNEMFHCQSIEDL